MFAQLHRETMGLSIVSGMQLLTTALHPSLPYFNSRTQIFRKLIGSLLSPCA